MRADTVPPHGGSLWRVAGAAGVAGGYTGARSRTARRSSSAACALRHNRARTLLIVGELAVTLVLMIGASLLVESFVRLLRVDPGYESSNVATAQITLPASRYPAARRAVFYEELLARSAGLPSVETAGLAASLPLGPGRSNAGFRFEDGAPASGPARPMSADLRIVSPGYFKVLGPRLRAGRVLSDADRPDTPRVALVNEAFVRTYLGGDAPGRTHDPCRRGSTACRSSASSATSTTAALTAAPVPEIYRSFRQIPGGRRVNDPRAARVARCRRPARADPCARHRNGPGASGGQRDDHGSAAIEFGGRGPVLHGPARRVRRTRADHRDASAPTA